MNNSNNNMSMMIEKSIQKPSISVSMHPLTAVPHDTGVKHIELLANGFEDAACFGRLRGGQLAAVVMIMSYLRGKQHQHHQQTSD